MAVQIINVQGIQTNSYDVPLSAFWDPTTSALVGGMFQSITSALIADLVSDFDATRLAALYGTAGNPPVHEWVLTSVGTGKLVTPKGSIDCTVYDDSVTADNFMWGKGRGGALRFQNAFLIDLNLAGQPTARTGYLQPVIEQYIKDWFWENLSFYTGSGVYPGEITFTYLSDRVTIG